MERPAANSIDFQTGATLVELVVSIVVISIGLSGVLIAMNRNIASSADPLILHQAVAVAEAYTEEIVAKDFAGPDGTDTVFGPDGGETRATFDSVNDYHGLSDNTGARDQNGGLVAGLGQYAVSVQVVSQALGVVPAANAALITVTVNGPGGISYVLSAYRTRY